MGLSATLQRFKTDWRLLGPLLLANLAGMVFGWYYYADVGQFDVAHLSCGGGAGPYCQPWWTWVLVADSPNAVLLFFAAALAYRLTGWRSKWLDAAAFILNVYVGLWTTLLFVTYADAMGTYDWGSVAEGNANPVLFIAHMGMPLQAFVLMPDMKADEWKLPGTLLVAAAAAAYIYVDYWGPVLHPAPFLHPDDRVLHLGSPWLMVVAVALWWAARPRRRRRPNREFSGSPGTDEARFP